MNFFFGNIFWGMLLVLWGASLILKTFNINMPLAKIFVAVVIILFGVKLLIGTGGRTISRERNNKGSYYRSNRSGEYTLVFSSGTIDLRDLSEDSPALEITVVFGNATVLLPRHLNFDIEPTSVFGATVLPDKSHYGFGASRYHAGKDEGRVIYIESTSVFGRLEYVFEDVEHVPPVMDQDPVPEDSGAQF
jgi:predicted membrane protein